MTIALADAAMSLDNVIAIAAVARGDHWLFIIGLVLSIPLIVVGAALCCPVTSWPVRVEGACEVGRTFTSAPTSPSPNEEPCGVPLRRSCRRENGATAERVKRG